MGETDLISRQAAIDAIQKERHEAWEDLKDDTEYRKGYDDGLAESMRILTDDLPSAQPYANDALEDAYAHGYTYAESKFREMLDTQPEIIYCKDCVHHIDGFFCRQANHHTSDKDHCASVFGAERREE